MPRVLVGSTAGLVTVAAIATAFLMLGSHPAAKLPAAQAQGGQPQQRAHVKREQRISSDAPTIQPAVENLHRQTSQPAHIESFETTAVYAKASGFLKSVQVDIGDYVKKDQVLAELWIPEMDQQLLQKSALVEQARSVVEQSQAQVATAKALVMAAEAELAEAKAAIAQHEAELVYRRSEHRRITELVQSRSVNEAIQDEKLKQLQSAEAALVAAHARVRSEEALVLVEQARQQEVNANLSLAHSQFKVAEANLEQTKIIMKYAQIRSPFDGLITRRWIDSGDFVASAVNGRSEPLFTVEHIDKLRLVFDVPETESAQIQIGQPTTLVVDALKNRSFKGRIARTAGVLDPKTRTLRVEAELDQPATSLRPGMYGMITVTLVDRDQAVILPTRYIHYDGQGPFVFCAVNGLTEKRKVEIGYSDSTRSEIVSGVDPQDVVLVDALPASGSAATHATALRP
jgi:HlyD family secretion protein